MLKKALIVAVALCGSAPAAWSQAALVSYETGIEASTDYVSVPSAAYGAWSVTPCAGCATVVLRLDAKSEYFVGREPVALATLRKYAARGTSHLDVYYETKTLRVTRIVLRAQLDAVDVPGKQQPTRGPKVGAPDSRTQS